MSFIELMLLILVALIGMPAAFITGAYLLLALSYAVGFILFIGVEFATTFLRDMFNVPRYHQLKLSAQPPPKTRAKPSVIMIGCFPITVYVGLGSIVNFAVYRMMIIAYQLAQFSRLHPFRGMHEPPEWHRANIILVLFFPITGFILFLLAGLLLISGLCAAGARLLSDYIISMFWTTLQTSWKWAGDTVEEIWQNISNRF